MITPDQFKAVFPSGRDPATWASAISDAWSKFAFVTTNAQAGYLGICGNETGGFRNVKTEDTSWNAEQMERLFHVPPAQAAALVQTTPENRANVCYAGKIGNGDVASGDGFRYRGRGIIQLTGRDNYKACSDAIGVDLVADPDSLTQTPARSAAAAAWFIAKRAKILSALDQPDEASFLAAAEKVGHTLPDATQRRLDFRRAALAALAGNGAAVPVGGGVAPAGFDAARVTRIQAALNQAGASPTLATDGVWGPRTQAAADRFRQDHNLPPTDGPTEDLAQALGVA